MTIIEPSVKLEWITPNAIKLIEMAARTCYKSEPTDESPDSFVQRIALQRGHESVLEHGCASFRIITDRGITHEIVRHRIASYSQESTRYVNYTKDKHGAGDIQFIMPLDLNDEQVAFFEESFWTLQKMYNRAIELGCTPQQARDLLPNAVKTEIVMTCNFREWMHFLKLRTSKAAHPKMRVVAGLLGKELGFQVPALFGQYNP